MPRTLCQLVFGLCFLFTTNVSFADDAWKIERFVLPASRWPGFQGVAMDETGTLWTLAQQHVNYFDGQQFIALDRNHVHSGRYETGLFGGGPRGLYLTQPGDDDQQLQLFRLHGHESEFVTTVRTDGTRRLPGLYVAKNGRIFNWRRDFLAVYADLPLAIVPEKRWTQINAKFSLQAELYPPAICDLGDVTYFYSLQENRIYCCDAQNKLSVAEGPAALTEFIPDEDRATDPALKYIAASFGGEKIVVLKADTLELVAFNVRTGDLVELTLPDVGAKELAFQDAVGLAGGSVWFSPAEEKTNQATRNLYELTADGAMRELPGTQGLGWTHQERAKSIGAIQQISERDFLLTYKGLTLYRDGKQTELDQRHGFFAKQVAATIGAAGEVWTVDDPRGCSLVRITLGSGDPPLNDETQDWTSYLLAGENLLWRLSDNTIGIVEADRPQQLTRITAGQVTYQSLSFAPTAIVRSIVDDQGSLLVELSSERVFAIRPTSVEPFPDLETALAHSVASGAVQFQTSPDIASVFLDQDQRLWFAVRHDRQIKLLEKGTWRTIPLDAPLQEVLPFPVGGAVVITKNSQPLQFQGEKFAPFPPEVRYYNGIVSGPVGLAADTTAPQMRYYPIRREFHGLHLFDDAADFSRAIAESEFTLQNALKLPPILFHGQGQGLLKEHVERNPFGERRSRYWGSWSPFDPKPREPFVNIDAIPTQIFDLSRFVSDLNHTPLPSKPHQIIASANGDLWFAIPESDPSFPADRAWRVYRHAQSRLSLQATDVPAKCDRELTVSVNVQPRRPATPVRLFATIDGELQPTNGTLDEQITFRFLDSGTHRCVIFGERLSGILRDPIVFTVTADVPLPNTIWYSLKTQVTVNDRIWDAPVKATPSAEGRQPSLFWRIDDGEWRPFGQRRNGPAYVDLSEYKSGDYVIEFRASEDDYWHDPTPASVKLHYIPE